jgi:hypothetical protein
VSRFFEEILKAYNIEMHHLTPNGIAKIALFIWAVKSQGLNLDINAFCALHESIHNFGVRLQMERRLSFILAVVALSRFRMQNILPQLQKISGVKTGISFSFIILFPLLKRGMSHVRW